MLKWVPGCFTGQSTCSERRGGLGGGLCAGFAMALGISNVTVPGAAMHPVPHESFFRWVAKYNKRKITRRE
ncbi:MAG: hypothetical protein D6732_27805 [Methanobacteriota archaeon]|nr:MAG: hypothetical protein D6732_27805 [Euryarchaeota archaeon]